MAVDNKAILAIIGKPAKKDEGKSEGTDNAETAAQELLGAIRDEDPKAVVEAFKALSSLCYEPDEAE